MGAELIKTKHGFKVDPKAGVIYGKRGREIGIVGTRGYMQVGFIIDGCNSMTGSHRVIWEATHGAIPAGMEINHKNGIKADNRIENLELCTRGENVRHSIATGLKRGRPGRPVAILDHASVRNIRASAKKIAELARMYGVSELTISNVRHHKTWKEAA